MKQKTIYDYLFFMEAWILLHVSKGIILFFSFKKIASSLGSLNKETRLIVEEQMPVIDICNAIRRAAKFSLHKSNCYDQALAGKIMLKWRGLPSTIYFGLSKSDPLELIAHAWLRCGSQIVTGKLGLENYTIIACYGDLDVHLPSTSTK